MLVNARKKQRFKKIEGLSQSVGELPFSVWS